MAAPNHAVRAHALLSASGASRWMTCTPSARLEDAIRSENLAKGIKEPESEFAKEGTVAHELSEILLAHELGQTTKAVKTRTLNKFIKANEEFYSEEMLDYVQVYVDYVMEEVNAARAESSDAQALIEQRLDFSAWVPGGFGTGDMLVLTDKHLRIIDLKYGKGIPVTAVENKQMMIYALGAIAAHDLLWDFEDVSMTIVQPRLDSISTYVLSKDELMDWAESVLKPTAEKAFDGEGDFVAGEHCRFCDVKATCRARSEQMLSATMQDFEDEEVTRPELLTPEEIADLLFVVDDVAKWAKDVKSYAQQAMVDGDTFDGWKLVEGRANRRYVNEAEVVSTLAEITADPDEKLSIDDVTTVPVRKPIAITQLEKKLGKKRFEEVLHELVVKPQGAPTLAPVTDTRPAIGSMEQAMADFED